ncbi:hypothetical protein LZZ85_28195 [Terrimonas sp. NA20]|uniref:Lipocalin-like domain-containing protein n=1 Tax=Terrimonas ginsenosidimutans TaxID=2908004 RepID=A0ABS9L0R2_9BACT|nr:hypothetical protein [Terrimonas ginsenosidimutans]MCG2618209.1 hypothetical protein [Terrimonas ginsenosidimutans]
MRRLTGLLLFLTLSICSDAQDMNGFWKGRLIMEPGGCFPVYNIEFQLQINSDKISGNSYHYSDTSNYVKEIFEGVYDTANKVLTIEEQRVSVFRIPADCVPCIKKYQLTFHTDGKEEQLRGNWSGKTMDGKTTCPPGTIIMTRINKPAFRPELPANVASKKMDLVKEIFVDTGTIRLDFYDNGQIDGDTISVYANNFPIVSRKLLSTKPVTAYVRITLDEQMQELVMFGENLGTIPPNTALMIVDANDKRYQLFMSSDDKKNAMVRFIYQKPK